MSGRSVPPADGTLECIGGPFDGEKLNRARGEPVRVLEPGWSGTYVLRDGAYHRRPD